MTNHANEFNTAEYIHPKIKLDFLETLPEDSCSNNGKEIDNINYETNKNHETKLCYLVSMLEISCSENNKVTDNNNNENDENHKVVDYCNETAQNKSTIFRKSSQLPDALARYQHSRMSELSQSSHHLVYCPTITITTTTTLESILPILCPRKSKA